MLIFLYGENTYRAKQKLNQIIERYKKNHKSGLNLKYFDAKEVDFKEISDKLKVTSMFNEKKLVVLKGIFSSKKFKEEFLKQPKELVNTEDIIVIYQRGKVDKRKKLFKFLEKKSKYQEFKMLKDKELKDWIEKEFSKHNSKITKKALTTLVNYVGNNIWHLVNEIEKLVSYKNRETVKQKDVKLLVKSKVDTDIFKTIDAIAEKDKRKALNLVNKHFKKGDSPLYVLSMINYQFRNLLIIKDLIEKHIPYRDIFKKTNLHPFVVKKSYFQSKKFSLSKIKKVHQMLFKMDFEIKTGKIEPDLALELLITKI